MNTFKRIKIVVLLFPLLLFTTNPTNATDIENLGFRLLDHAVVAQQIQISMLFFNVGWGLAANIRGTVTVRDAAGAVVHQESVETSTEVQPGSEGELMSVIPWIPELPGDYSIETFLEPLGMNDVNGTNNEWEEMITVFEPPPGWVLLPGQGLLINQVDFNFDGAQQENSTYGLASLDWLTAFEFCGFDFGYLNISNGANWLIQNMIFDLSSGYTGLSGYFNLDLGDGVLEEDILEIDLIAHLSETPLIDFDFQPVTTFDVGNRPYRAEGVGMPVGNIPSPIPFERLPFVEGGKSELVWQHGHVSIEQDYAQCAPGAVSNSFQWLENKQGVNIPDDHKPGIRDSTLIGKLDTAMNRATHTGVAPINTLNGKLKYLGSSGVGNHLKVKHKNVKGGTILPDSNHTMGGVTSFANTDTTVSLIDWILAELDSNENVEMRIQWPGGGGHIVDLIGGGYVDGVPWLAWTHDANQGFDNNGTAGNTADDKVAMNGGISADSGGVGWSYLVNNQLKCFIGGESSLGTISYGISESKKEATDIAEIEKVPDNYYLSQNYPNPFNPSTTIFYSIPQRAHVSLTVFDILGRQIAVLLNQEKSAGNYEVEFNAGNLASGIYVYELKAGKFTTSKKMILLR